MASDLCLVCMDRPEGYKLHPCGHDQFCMQCAVQFRSCPLCRASIHASEPRKAPKATNVLPTTSEGTSPATLPRRRAAAPPGSILTVFEMSFLFSVWAIFTVFIFFLGAAEMNQVTPTVLKELELPECNQSEQSQHAYIGEVCLNNVTLVPAVSPGGQLGGDAYFALIIIVQLLGVATEIALIYRLLQRGRMPKKELAILVVALLGEAARMWCVDTIVLSQIFHSDRSYSVIPYSSNASSSSTEQQQQLYVLGSNGTTGFYDPDECTLFSRDSALLDFPTEPDPMSAQGHFFKMGWFLGGGSAVIYLFATFVNEVADVIFVIPASSRYGVLCKVASVGLEFFQLGCLLPFAIFHHGRCLLYTAPLNADLFVLRAAVKVCWFVVGLFGLTFVPLAAIGLGLVFLPHLVATAALLAAIFVLKSCGVQTETLEARERAVQERMRRRVAGLLSTGKGAAACFTKMGLAFLFAFVPLLLVIGLWFGTYVVVGQLSKRSYAEQITAVSLLFDVAFKVGATAVTEVCEYALHYRVSTRMKTRCKRKLVEQVSIEEEAHFV